MPVVENKENMSELSVALYLQLYSYIYIIIGTARTVDIEADISQLEAPTFTTIQRGPPEPFKRLEWKHKVMMIGEKVLNPMIHCCDRCELPILTYGRMIPCKHVFCLMCAKQEQASAVREFVCPRCKDKVSRVEQSGLGSVFMCTHGGTRYNNKGCRRTYLSQRDLQAHINHRHVVVPAEKADAKMPANRKPASNTPSTSNSAAAAVSSNTFRPLAMSSGGASLSSVRTNLLNMQESHVGQSSGTGSGGGSDMIVDDAPSSYSRTTSSSHWSGNSGSSANQQQSYYR